MIKVIIGDIFKSSMQTKVNTVNCVGVMGKGIAEQFKKLYPEMYEDYKIRCNNKEIKPGEPYLYTTIFGEKIINFPTKYHWSESSKIEYIEKGLDIFIKNYKEWGIESVAFPPLGCGNGGLEWSQVGPLMYQKLSNLDLDIEIYAPHGAKNEQLNKEFLTNPISNIKKATQQESTLLPGWIAILEILYRLEQMKYTKYVGRISFQKICYLATLKGLNTGLNFVKGKYGPYSAKVNDMFRSLNNANLIIEEQSGKLKRVKIGTAYKEKRELFLKKIDKDLQIVDDIVNLFSRIKSTEQAEEVATILYALNELSKSQGKKEVSEIDFYNYILNWKKSWNNERKKYSIATSIRNLAMLGWLNLEYSDDLPLPEEEK